jgi:hypothetical protein
MSGFASLRRDRQDAGLNARLHAHQGDAAASPVVVGNEKKQELLPAAIINYIAPGWRSYNLHTEILKQSGIEPVCLPYWIMRAYIVKFSGIQLLRRIGDVQAHQLQLIRKTLFDSSRFISIFRHTGVGTGDFYN